MKAADRLLSFNNYLREKRFSKHKGGQLRSSRRETKCIKLKLSAVSSSEGLTGVPITLIGVSDIYSRTGHGNMSVSRKSRKAKLLNLEDQPQILQFITDSVSEVPRPRKESKKRRRSTGEKSQAKKRVDSPCSQKTSDPHSQSDITTQIDSQDSIACTLSKMHVEETNSGASSTSPMLDEIMKMEARLTASITTNRDKEISDMETRLNANIKSTIDTQTYPWTNSTTVIM